MKDSNKIYNTYERGYANLLAMNYFPVYYVHEIITWHRFHRNICNKVVQYFTDDGLMPYLSIELLLTSVKLMYIITYKVITRYNTF